MQKVWLPVRISQIESRWISNPLLVLPIRKYSIKYNMRRDAMDVWVIGWFVTLLFKIKESVRNFLTGLYDWFDLFKKNKKNWGEKVKKHWCNFETSAGQFQNSQAQYAHKPKFINLY